LQLSDAPSQREAAIKKYGKKIVSVMVWDHKSAAVWYKHNWTNIELIQHKS
jgi:hypothetical protein